MKNWTGLQQITKNEKTPALYGMSCTACHTACKSEFLQNTKDQKPSLAETLISDEKDVICKGTVYKIENKSQSTAIYLKDAVVSCTDQKSKNQTIKEKKILITIKIVNPVKNQNENRTEAECVGTKQSFHPPRNPGNFNQKVIIKNRESMLGF